MIDRDKVINGLEQFRSDLKPFCGNHADWERFDAALAMLKEREAVKPYIDIDEAKCPICKVKLTRQELFGDDVLFEDFFDYCPHCGRSVKWDA